MTNPGSFGRLVPRAEDHLHRRVAELEKLVNRLMTQRTLESAIIGKGGLTIQGGSLTLKALDGTVLQVMDADGIALNGDFTIEGGTVKSANYAAGSAGYRFRNDGVAEFNDLVLRGGIVGNDALTNPLESNFYFAQANNYALTASTPDGTATARATITVTIPSGFTTATVFAAVQDSAWNDSTFPDYIFSCINFTTPGADYVYQASATVPSPSQGTSIVVTTDQFTGLTGGDTVSIQSRPSTSGHAWSADPVNSTVMSVLALFFR